MYLALRPPWASHSTAPSDAGVVAVGPSDAGSGKAKHRGHGGGGHHRGGGGAGGAGGNLVTGDDGSWNGGDDNTVEETEPQLIKLTPADRVLEWRGDDTTKTKQQIDMSNNAESRALDDGEIQNTISSQSGPTQSCVMQAATNTDLKGTITVRMIVDGGGHPTKVKVQAPHYMFEHGVLPCIQGAVRKIKFPGVGQSTLVTMPINFS
jgi:hypothetical protein